ncbi:MAG: triose-phosphate isomerase [Phycisphaerales bacterium]|nr:triose-phosphate isomerase [Phycisphaerales bacterium]
MSERRPFVGGNWKMNSTLKGASELIRGVADALAGEIASIDVAVFPPCVYLLAVKSILRDRQSPIMLGAQDVYPEAEGAFTGEVSVDMLRDCGVQVVLAGHSERRHVIGEDDELINRKVKAILEGGLRCVLCIGETLDQREDGRTHEVNEIQLRSGLAGIAEGLVDNLVIAYEPVWAIGTGQTATPDDAEEAHEKIREVLKDMYDGVSDRLRIIYGGSVKPGNAAGLFGQRSIDGGLIGGASLKVADFVPIVRASMQSVRSGSE